MFSMIDRRWALVNGVGVWATASSVGRVTCRRQITSEASGWNHRRARGHWR
jgi:hypothetical protein